MLNPQSPLPLYHQLADRLAAMIRTGEYEGGGLRFPEFGPRVYRPAAGEAIVFSCSLLHEAMAVTHGERFVLLGFLLDEAGVRERDAFTTELARRGTADAATASSPAGNPAG